MQRAIGKVTSRGAAGKGGVLYQQVAEQFGRCVSSALIKIGSYTLPQFQAHSSPSGVLLTLASLKYQYLIDAMISFVASRGSQSKAMYAMFLMVRWPLHDLDKLTHNFGHDDAVDMCT